MRFWCGISRCRGRTSYSIRSGTFRCLVSWWYNCYIRLLYVIYTDIFVYWLLWLLQTSRNCMKLCSELTSLARIIIAKAFLRLMWEALTSQRRKWNRLRTDRTLYIQRSLTNACGREIGPHTFQCKDVCLHVYIITYSIDIIWCCGVRAYFLSWYCTFYSLFIVYCILYSNRKCSL